MKNIIAAFGLSVFVLGTVGCADDATDGTELPATLLAKLNPNLDVVVIDAAQWSEDPELEQDREANRIGEQYSAPLAQATSNPIGRPGEGGDWHEDSEQDMENEANEAAASLAAPRASACFHTSAYLDAWASKHVGCDVCVVFACGGGDYRYSCQTCQ